MSDFLQTMAIGSAERAAAASAKRAADIAELVAEAMEEPS